MAIVLNGLVKKPADLTVINGVFQEGWDWSTMYFAG